MKQGASIQSHLWNLEPAFARTLQCFILNGVIFLGRFGALFAVCSISLVFSNVVSPAMSCKKDVSIQYVYRIHLISSSKCWQFALS